MIWISPVILRRAVTSICDCLPARHQCPFEISRTNPDARLDSWIRSKGDESLYLSAITIGELQKGISLLAQGKRRSRLEAWLEEELIPVFAGRILPVTQVIAERWGSLSAQRQPAGRPLSMADGLIAATALEHGLILVTRNVREFDGLNLSILTP